MYSYSYVNTNHIVSKYVRYLNVSKYKNDANLLSIQKLLFGENSDIPCSLITANESFTFLQTNSLKSIAVTSKSLYEINH